MRGDAEKWDTEKCLSLRDKGQRGLNMGRDSLRVETVDLKKKLTVIIIIFNQVIQNILLTL